MNSPNYIAPWCHVFALSLKGKLLGMYVLFLFGVIDSNAQVQVFAHQPASFGSFVVGQAGGTIRITEDDERIVEGNIILLNQGSEVMPAIFAVEAPLGATVHIQLGPDVMLKGSNGGEGILRMHYPGNGSSFISTVSPPDRNYISIPVSLILQGGMQSYPGNYSGTMSITVLEE